MFALVPVVSPRFLALLVVSHFLACAFAWNPKTNLFVIELSISTFVLGYCVVETLVWWFLLLTSVIEEGGFQVLIGFFGDSLRGIEIGLVLLWGAGFAKFLRHYEKPRNRDFYGALSSLIISGVLLFLTLRIPFVVNAVYQSHFPDHVP